MEQKVKKRYIFPGPAPVRMWVSIAALLAVVCAYQLRINGGMGGVYAKVSRPYHEFMMGLCAHAGFSVAEAFYAVAVGLLLTYIVCSVIRIIRRKDKWRQVYTTMLTLVMICLLFWGAYSYLWTPYYYTPTFSQQSGISDEAVATAELEAVTQYFADKVNEYAPMVKRNENGLFTADRDAVLDKAAQIYSGAAEKWDFLSGKELRPKGIVCSKVMSLLDFTGFFFPLTGEANVNMDSPAVMLPFTALHELTHQRGVGAEQECNFIAAVACMDSGDSEYEYSGALSAYIYLGNALYKADRDAWRQVRSTLCQSALDDLADNTAYWEDYETAVSRVSNSAYESFLQGNGQTLGLESYGACVDMLVNYYYPQLAVSGGT